MLKLYGGARSRASIVQWYLEELGVAYEFVLLDMQAGEHLQPAYLAINPVGKVPAIADGDFVLWESGAILLYLADRYAQPNLSPEQRATLAQWILYANATISSEVANQATREKALPRHMGMLNHLFERQPFVLGAQFSAADVAIGALLAYIPLLLQVDLSGYPAIMAYMGQMAERPAFQKTIGSRT
jgi:glutathione S-transferase